MKIVLISTNSADESALVVAHEALKAEHDAHLTRWRPGGVNNTPYDVVLRHLEIAPPDLCFIHGDRWDALIAATAATVARVKIAHLGGGDVTEGSYDNRFRDAITRLADVHFVSTNVAAERIRVEITHGYSEDDERERHVHVVREPALDWLKTVKLPDRATFMATLGLELFDGFVLVNWQPETLAAAPNKGLVLILNALVKLSGRVAIMFARVNNDHGAPEAIEMIHQFVRQMTGRRFVGGPTQVMTRETYAAALKYCDCMVGNSSSGLIEAPAFGTPFALVGRRQWGRSAALNVSWFETDVPAMALARWVEYDAARIRGLPWNGWMDNPYGDGTAGEKIAAALREKVTA
jgi:UDP-hydrolysing UDP-N-acetyl-D-glucosamine 2-epimerase